MNHRPLEEVEARARGLVAGFLDQVEELGREIAKGFVRAHARGAKGGKKVEVQGYIRSEHSGPVERGLPMADEAERLANIAKVEMRIRDLPYEVFVGLDANGNPAWAQHGTESAVSLLHTEQKAMKDAQIDTFTHNHPSEFSTSFSRSDIRVACKLGVKEARAVGLLYAHSLSRRDGRRLSMIDWNIALEQDSQTVADQVWEGLQNQVRDGSHTMDQVNEVFWHEVWTEITRRQPAFVYTRTKWPDMKQERTDAAA